MTTEERLHYALAVLSSLEWTWALRATETCPVCTYPRHRGHEPGCSLRSILVGETPHRLVHLEATHGDAAFGMDGRDRRRHATPVAPAIGAEGQG